MAANETSRCWRGAAAIPRTHPHPRWHPTTPRSLRCWRRSVDGTERDSGQHYRCNWRRRASMYFRGPAQTAKTPEHISIQAVIMRRGESVWRTMVSMLRQERRCGLNIGSRTYFWYKRLGTARLVSALWGRQGGEWRGDALGQEEQEAIWIGKGQLRLQTLLRIGPGGLTYGR